MDSHYLGLISYASALVRQEDARQTLLQSGLSGVVLGFEPEPVITCGVRAADHDLEFSREEISRRGFSILPVDRGGQATVHNPGQLVIFPVWPIRAIGVRNWVMSLAEITRECLAEWKIEATWKDEQPGLHTCRGKIMACGVRVKQGISTHGIAINVRNDLADFRLIRSCGVQSAVIDRMGEEILLSDVYKVWTEKFRRAHG